MKAILQMHGSEKRRKAWLFEQPVHQVFLEIIRDVACVAGIGLIVLFGIAVATICLGLFSVATKIASAHETRVVAQKMVTNIKSRALDLVAPTLPRVALANRESGRGITERKNSEQRRWQALPL